VVALNAIVLDPDVPNDPLSPSAGADWAVARRAAVLALDVDSRVRSLLDALAELDGIVDDIGLEVLTDELIDESEIEILDDAESAAEAFVRAKTKAPEQMASAETIVLSGPEVKRKIRAKQSVMPSVIADNLFSDVKSLFEIGDREGALVSLERMIVVAPLTRSIKNFLSHNESRLLDYYQNVFGPFNRPVSMKTGDETMPAAYFALAKVAKISALIDGNTTVQEVIDSSGLTTIETCAVISQLYRSSSVEIGQVE
jgi:hypothetical protein